MADLAALTLADFSPLVHDTFRVSDPALELTLREAEAAPGTPPPGTRAPFSLMFGGPPEPLLRQGIHRLEHPALGPLELFLVPVAPDATGARYQAVFA